MARTLVLTIEDDEDIRGLLRAILGREGYGIVDAPTAREGLRAFHQTRPDIVILDIALPDIDGWEVLERIRDMSDAPVLVLTARSTEAEKVRGLNLGADDYLTKPFSHDELLARLQAIRRRVPAAPLHTHVDDGSVRIDFVRHQAYLDGEEVLLTPTEYRLLTAFVRRSGEVLSADKLLELAWDDDGNGEQGANRVKYAILRLRRKLGWESEDSPLKTVRGFGYRYEPPA